LRGLLRGGDTVEDYCKQIFQREAEADEVTREVLIAVRRSFITPFDRPDIQDLITSMDDAIDQMNKTAKTIVLFEVRSFEPQMQQMSEIILQSAKLVLEAVPLLSSIGSNAGRLNTLTAKPTSARNAASNSVWGTNIVPQAMQMRLFAHCVTKARQKAHHQLVVGRRLRCYLIIACHASRFVLAHAAQDHSPPVGHQSSQLCPSYPACIINMSEYDFRKGQGIIRVL
jgi:hypothetical protein